MNSPQQHNYTLPEELKIIAEHIHWYLSDWMPEEDIQQPIKALLDPDLLPIWRKLKKAANDQEAFEDFFCMATDSIYRHSQIAIVTPSQQKKKINEVIKAAEKLSNALNALQEINCPFPERHISNYATNQALLNYTLTPNKTLSPHVYENYPVRVHLQARPIVQCIIEDASKLMREPDARITNKTGRSGLIAFYTNSLCGVTDYEFSRRCYPEIASIANAVLQTNADAPITEENVRINFLNCLQRAEKANYVLPISH